MTFSGSGGQIKTRGVSMIEKAGDEFAASVGVATD